MKRILIADASKASLVMTSEVFKDHFPGVQVVVARTSAECLELVKSTENVDAYVIDFDLPDKDGAWTAARLKKLHAQTPVLITAFDRPDVHNVIEEELAAYDDCLNWLRKPVKAETVVAVAQRYCEGKYRTQRRLACSIPALAEVVVTTVLTRTVKETVKVPVAKSSAKSATSKTTAKPEKTKAKTSKAAASKNAAKSKTATAAKNTKAATTTKVVTRTITEKVQAKTLVPATITDSSLGGIKVEIDFSGFQAQGQSKTASGQVSWSVSAGEILSVHVPSQETLEAGNAKAWKDWQSSKLKLQAAANAATTATNPPPAPPASAKTARTTHAASAAAAMKGSKGPGTASTLPMLSQKTLKSAVKTAEDSSQILRGRVCWTTTQNSLVTCGVELDNAAQARRLFELTANRYNSLRRAGGIPSTHAQPPSTPVVTTSTLSFRNARHNAS